MGLFDEVVIHRSRLPANAPEHVRRCPVFQTYDLGRGMGEYSITEDGRVINRTLEELLKAIGKPVLPAGMLWKRKRLLLSTSNLRGGRLVGKKYRFFTENGEPFISVDYVVWIRNGRAGPIREVRRREEPALPMTKFAPRRRTQPRAGKEGIDG